MLESEGGRVNTAMQAGLENMEMSTPASEIRFEDDGRRLGCAQLVSGIIQVFLFATDKKLAEKSWFILQSWHYLKQIVCCWEAVLDIF